MNEKKIELRKVSVHNLREVSLDLPKNQLVVFTGVSGSGKSSLAFDTIYVEGQKRYVESLSTQAMRYFNNLGRIEAESLKNIPPTIAIEQKTVHKNPRSTVGTLTGIFDYLRVIFARLGTFYCPESHEVVTPTSRGQIYDAVLNRDSGSKLVILASLAKEQKGSFKDEFIDLLKKGYTKVRVDNEFLELEDPISLKKTVAHNIEVVIDRIVLSDENKNRVKEAIDSALNMADGNLIVIDKTNDEELFFSTHGFSKKSGIYYPLLEPEDFAFNHPAGMCERCRGLGIASDFDIHKIIDEDLSIADGCCEIAGSYHTVKWGNIYRNLSEIFRFDLKQPWKKLSKQAQDVFLYGTEDAWLKMVFIHPTTNQHWTEYIKWKGVLHEGQRRLNEATSNSYKLKMRALMTEVTCPDCKGSRIKPYPSAAKFKGKRIHEITELTVSEALTFFKKLNLNKRESLIGLEMINEVIGRLSFLENVGLHYLSISRTSATLSGGEAQRVRLAAGLGSGLVGCAYILDEPSIGLHARDNQKLIDTLHHLKAKGNTVIVVEHDEEMIFAADHIVDIGPKAGTEGGKVLAQGNLEQIMCEPKSITGSYLKRELEITIPQKRRKVTKQAIHIKGATHHNLQNIDVSFPLGVFIAVTGVSGSGKTSLILDTLYPALINPENKKSLKSIENTELIDKVISIDQSPIGRTPRSNPATYVKVFDHIRDLFASLPAAKAAGYQKGRFSFNVKSGSCTHCKGMGMVKIDMDFLNDEWVDCHHCGGQRFDAKTLDIRFKGKNIYEVLNLTITEAVSLFADIPQISQKLTFLEDVGLGYLKLGQSSTTLSGGEAQRIKLAKELMRPQTGKTFYILDEPTTGLHFHDIQNLNNILQQLVNLGNTVLVIEHNFDIIKIVDWMIDIGPEGGSGGGKIVGTGTPEDIAKLDTPTGLFLKDALQNKVQAHAKGKARSLDESAIEVRNAHQNNLKNLSLSIPRGEIAVFTGPSGSGKSSLAFETVFAEGNRRYIDSLPLHAKQIIGMPKKANVSEITNLMPAIGIEQRKHTGNIRSTLGTLTEVTDYLRIIYAKLGIAFCPETGERIEAITKDFVVEKTLKLEKGSKLQVLAPYPLKRKEELNTLQAKGYLRVRLNGKVLELTDELPFDPKANNKFEVVIDRLVINDRIKNRLFDAIEEACKLSDNLVTILTDTDEIVYNLSFAVPSTGKSYPKITPPTPSLSTLPMGGANIARVSELSMVSI